MIEHILTDGAALDQVRKQCASLLGDKIGSVMDITDDAVCPVPRDLVLRGLRRRNEQPYYKDAVAPQNVNLLCRWLCTFPLKSRAVI